MTAWYARGIHRTSDTWKNTWHKDGVSIYIPENEFITLEEGLHRIEMDQFVIEKTPLGDVTLSDGRKVKVSGDYALVATAPWLKEPKYLRTVGNRYKPMQITRMAKLLEGLNKEWPFAGMMILKDGKISIIQLGVTQYDIGGREEERHLGYLTVANDHIMNGIMWIETDIRAECWNTYSASLSSLKKIRIPHTDSTEVILEFMAEVEVATVAAQKEHQEQLNAMFTRKLTKNEIADVLDATFPEAGKTSKMKLAERAAAQSIDGELGESFFGLVDQDKKVVDWKNERQKELKVAVAGAYNRFSDEHSYTGDTAYALWQGVTEVINHSDLFTGAKDKQMVSLFFGQKQNMQENAWIALTDLL